MEKFLGPDGKRDQILVPRLAHGWVSVKDLRMTDGCPNAFILVPQVLPYKWGGTQFLLLPCPAFFFFCISFTAGPLRSAHEAQSMAGTLLTPEKIFLSQERLPIW